METVTGEVMIHFQNLQFVSSQLMGKEWGVTDAYDKASVDEKIQEETITSSFPG